MKGYSGIIPASLFCSALIFFLAGCAGDALSGGGDDFPNSITALGKKISENLQKEWLLPEVIDMDSVASSIEYSIEIDDYDHDPGILQKTEKTGSAFDVIDSLRFRYTETFIYRYYFRHTDSTNLFDTTLYRPGSIFAVSKRGAIEYLNHSMTEYYRVDDIDGDSVLLDPRSDLNQIVYHQEWHLQNGRIRALTTGIDAGPDRSFLSMEDNHILFLTALLTDFSDTLYYVDMHPAMGSPYIYNSQSTFDSVMIRIHGIWHNPSWKPWASRLESNSLIASFPASGKADYLTGYSSQEILGNGRTAVAWIENRQGDSSFQAGDTLLTHYNILPGRSDPLFLDSTAFTTVLTSDYPAPGSILLSGIAVRTQMSSGTEREFSFDFIADQEQNQNNLLYNGTFELFMKLDNELEVSVSGIVTNDQIIAEYSDSAGERKNVQWDRDGNVIY